MATFNINKTSNPGTLGFIAPTAGTPKNICSNFANTIGNVQSLSIQAHPSNGQFVYVLNTSAAADTTNGSNIIAILSAGQSIPISGPAQGGVNPNQFYIDVDSTGDKALPIVYGG